MERENPFQSPAPVEATGNAVSPLPIYRLGWSGLLFAIATCFALVMNGQVFTNGVIILVLCVASALPWFPLILSRTASHRRIAGFLVAIHLAIALITMATLPADYRFQQEFNQKMQKLKPNAEGGP